MMYRDRADAGRRLASALTSLAASRPVILGLPRGGVPVAAEVARALGAPLDVLVVRKLGLPDQPELAMGAIGEDGARVLNDQIIRQAHVTDEVIASVEARERAELLQRVERFRGGRPPVSLEGRVVVIVDDGIATGATARAACQIARERGATKVIVAVPVGGRDSLALLRHSADDVICLDTPLAFFAVGQAYADFRQVSDDEVVAALTAVDPAPAAPTTSDITMTLGRARLEGQLVVPTQPRGLVLFAHGSGSSHNSPRNRYVAGILNEAGLATYLFDLLTDAEAQDRDNVFNLELLGERLADATLWLRNRDDLAKLPLGYFGASTGAGAALLATLDPRVNVEAVVSRGGRPDLVGGLLSKVTTPTLLIVGGRDGVVIDMNRRAQERIPAECELTIVPGATHLFEEPGTLDQAAALARDWFLTHLGLSVPKQHDPRSSRTSDRSTTASAPKAT